MKRRLYTLSIFVILGIVILISRNIPQGYEHDIRFAFEKDGCRIYSFKSFDMYRDKKHYYTTCSGQVIEPDEVNITEVEHSP